MAASTTNGARRSRSEREILRILRAGRTSARVAAVLRKYRVSDTTYYRWKRKYGAPADSRRAS